MYKRHVSMLRLSLIKMHLEHVLYVLYNLIIICVMMTSVNHCNPELVDPSRGVSIDGAYDLPDNNLSYRNRRSLDLYRRALAKILHDAINTPSIVVYTKSGGYGQALQDFRAVTPRSINDLGNRW